MQQIAFLEPMNAKHKIKPKRKKDQVRNCQPASTKMEQSGAIEVKFAASYFKKSL